MAADEAAPDPEPMADDEAIFEAGEVYAAQTQRLRALGVILRVMHSSGNKGLGYNAEPEVDEDVQTAHNLALITVYGDIRRITGAGLRVAPALPKGGA